MSKFKFPIAKNALWKVLYSQFRNYLTLKHYLVLSNLQLADAVNYWLIDCIVFYAVSTILQPYNGGCNWLMSFRDVPSAGETSKFTNNHCLLIVAAVIWPKYRRYGVKYYIINQSISFTFLHGILFTFSRWRIAGQITVRNIVPMINRAYSMLKIVSNDRIVDPFMHILVTVIYTCFYSFIRLY